MLTSIAVPIDELAQARAELTQLEEKARGLFKQLLDVRARIATQQAKIDELSRTNLKRSPINHIPTEILVSILDLDVHTHDHPERKEELANVCQSWRDVILRTPCFWSTIYVASDTSSINTHLERSRGTLLDIVIEGVPSSPLPKHHALLPGLDIVMACAHRWRSLLVTASLCFFDDDPEAEGEELLTEFIADRINHLHFPSLKNVTISPLCDVGYLDFLSRAHAPALEYLELNEFMTMHVISNPVAMLKTLKLDFDAGAFIDYPSFWSLVPTQALTKLSLSGETKSFLLQPNSLYFPSLVLLEMDGVTETRPILDAIVAPNLKEVNCSRCYDSPSVTSSESRSKFTNVRRLSLSCSVCAELHYGDAVRFCESFPGVHHVKLDAEDWPYLFNPPSSQLEPGRNSDNRYPMDLWTELKSLTFKGLHSEWLRYDQPTTWLVHRRALGQQQLHVKVKESCRVQELYERSIWAYKCLNENCNLELDGPSSSGVSS